MSPDEREAYFENNSDTHELMLRRFPNPTMKRIVWQRLSQIEARPSDGGQRPFQRCKNW